LSHSLLGYRQDRTTILEPTQPGGSGGSGATSQHPETLRLQPRAPTHHSISRRGVVEVTPRSACRSRPIPFSVAALAGPLNLGRGPLEGGAHLISLDLGHATGLREGNRRGVRLRYSSAYTVLPVLLRVALEGDLICLVRINVGATLGHGDYAERLPVVVDAD
jgi:hypothetical protein